MNSTFLRTAGLLIVSNTFMTFAWYAHLRNLMRQPIRLDFLWAALCILGAVFFMFRSHGLS